MSWRPEVIVILLSFVALTACARSTTEDQGSAQQTQARGYWVDPSTGLMWTAKDNGKDVNWRNATSYCRDLRLAGISGWRLATIDELEGIYDRNARSPGRIPRVGKRDAYDYNFNVKGNIYLTGDPWSSSLIVDDRGRPPKFGWNRDFSQDGRTYDELSFASVMRALCVRRAKAQTPAQEPNSEQETQASEYWVDPATKLMWAARDNLEDVSWHKATKYCRDLRLAGYTDWRLATIDELQGIYDQSAESPGVNPRSHWHAAEPTNWHVKGNLLVTGNHWSSTQRLDDRGHPSGYAWRFDFNEGRSFDGDELSFEDNKRALCVRDSAAVAPSRSVGATAATNEFSTQTLSEDLGPPPEAQDRSYWVDPSTRLTWPATDNGKDVTWHQAAKYCRDLRLAGFADWRLPTLDELASLVDKGPSTPEPVGNVKTFHINLGRHIRGDLILTGDPWSSNREMDRFGHPYGDGYFFDFVNSRPSGDLPYFRNTKYALCVRSAGN
jgi:hypothetical protein